MIRPIERLSLRQKISMDLLDAILRGEILPGERLVEDKLARQLDVSKTTLREALQGLEHQGLLTKQDHRGTFVTKLSQHDIEDAYAVRLRLEPFAAALAHEHMTPRRFAELASVLEEMRVAAERGEFVEVYKVDAQFHQLIWRQSGNALLEKALEMVCLPLWAFDLIRLHTSPTYDLAVMIEEHENLLTVLKRGGPERVSKTFEKMITAFLDQDVRNLQTLDSKQGSSEAAPPPKKYRRSASAGNSGGRAQKSEANS
jgi:DNA-binding GntR family transcriptional regulator